MRGLDQVSTVERYAELDSTNNRAAQLAADSKTLLPALIVAASQTAGRGRGANRWWSGDGALTFSLLIDASGPALPPTRWPLVSLAAALAVSDVVAALATNSEVQLKWPNDVFIGSRKVCGILVESPPFRPARLTIGIGLNVNNSLREAPDELRAKATSLVDTLDERFDLDAVLGSIIDHLFDELAALACSRTVFVERWSKRCLLRGKTVWIEAGDRKVIGRCAGIDQSGALMVDTLGSRERLFAGIVRQWE